MSARILVVDDIPANVKLLEARLSAEYFDVLTASNGAEALAMCARAECDIVLLDDRPSSYERLAPMLSAEHHVDVESDPTQALFHAAEGNYDLLIVSLSLDNFDGLRLCSQARSLERTRQVPILAISDADNNARLLRGLEIGVNDYLLRPVDKNELLARARTQIR